MPGLVPGIHVFKLHIENVNGRDKTGRGAREEGTRTMQDLMKGKRGLIMGVANDHSIAWGIAKALAAQGAELAFTFQGDALGKRVKPLAQSLGVELVLPCDVENIASVDSVFETLRDKWGQLDFLVHAIAFSDKNELKGRYADTSRENFSRTMLISCFSFTELAKRAAELMPASGGTMITLTFGGSTRVMPNYNVMGVAKAALEASVRYLASDFGSDSHPGGFRYWRCAHHVCVPAEALAARPRRHAGRTRRLGAVSAVGIVRRRDRRNAFRRFRVQRNFDAPAGRFEGHGGVAVGHPAASTPARWNAGRAAQRSM
jgi:enoyl-[acyl-carrier-protein] reductase (NADH)